MNAATTTPVYATRSAAPEKSEPSAATSASVAASAGGPASAAPGAVRSRTLVRATSSGVVTVSYTHLTLPTICSV